MRWVALAFIVCSLPVFIAWLGKNKARRDQALLAISALTFASGSLQADAALISWSQWPGIATGILLSPIDTLALALILTRRRGADGLPFRVLMVVYSLPILVSIAVSALPMASAFVFVRFLQSMLLFIAVAGELTRPSALRSLLVGLALGLIVQSGFLIEQKMRGVVQATGTFPHQNILGMMVEMSVLPLIAAVLEGDKRKVIYAGVVAGLVVVAGGGSRGSMAFLAIGIAVLIPMSLSRHLTPHKLKVLGLGVLAAAIVVPLGAATLKDRFGESTLITSEDERTAYKNAAIAMAADYPLGVGANLFVTTTNTQGYSARAGVAWNVNNRSAPVHNAYLLARAETGWAGELALIALFAIPAVAGIRLAFTHRKGERGGIALGSTVAILAIAIHNNFEYAWHLQQPQTLFFINFAVIAGCIRAHRIEQRERRKRSREPEAQFRSEPLPEPSGLSGRPA